MTGGEVALIALIVAAASATAATGIKAASGGYADKNVGDAFGDLFRNLLISYGPAAATVGVGSAAGGAGAGAGAAEGAQSGMTAADLAAAEGASGYSAAVGAGAGASAGAGSTAINTAVASADEMAMMAEPALEGMEAGVNAGEISTGAAANTTGQETAGVFDNLVSMGDKVYNWKANLFKQMGVEGDPEQYFDIANEALDVYDPRKREQRANDRWQQGQDDFLNNWAKQLGQNNPYIKQGLKQADIWETEQEELRRMMEDQGSLSGALFGEGSNWMSS